MSEKAIVVIGKPEGTHNDEVVQPVASGGESHPFAPQTRWENLRRHRPGPGDY